MESLWQGTCTGFEVTSEMITRHYTAPVFHCHWPVLDSRLAVIVHLPVDSSQNGSKYQKYKNLETKVNIIQRLNAGYQKEDSGVYLINSGN